MLLREQFALRCRRRRTSFGSDSVAGSLFVSRLLTVITSLKLQERNIFDFLVESVVATRFW